VGARLRNRRLCVTCWVVWPRRHARRAEVPHTGSSEESLPEPAGTRTADLISKLIWRLLGTELDAEITCDAIGSAVHDGGVSATLRDLGRFGQMLLEDGAVDCFQVVPRRWLTDSYHPEPELGAVFGADNAQMFPDGWLSKSILGLPFPPRTDPAVPGNPRPADIRSRLRTGSTRGSSNHMITIESTSDNDR
jgi:CubicO group peptidase (beta-lactamase class C family)